MSTSRVQPIALGGQMVLAGSAIVSGSAVATLTVSGLNLDADGSYYVEVGCKNATGVATYINWYYNGDTTDANYDAQMMVGTGGSTGVVRVNDRRSFYMGASSSCVGNFNVQKDTGGKPSMLGNTREDETTGIRCSSCSHRWRTAANVTSISIGSATGTALDVGTYIRVYKLVGAAAQIPHVVNGRLTLESGVPISTTDQTAKTTIYFTPFRGNQVGLWNGSAWSNYTFTEVSLALGTITASQCYDVFGYISGSTIALEMLAWTNSTTRATAVTLQDGRYCKSGDKTRLYLGTFYTTSTTTTEDSAGGSTTQVGGKRYLWNYYNRVPREISVIDKTNNWTYSVNTARQANAAAGNKIEFITGLGEDAIDAILAAGWYGGGNAGSGACGIGIDSTTVMAKGTAGLVYCNASAAEGTAVGMLRRVLSVGYHYLAWIEKGASGGTTIFLGAGAVADEAQSGLSAIIQC